MRERVYLRMGTQPVIMIAPHGADDTHTATIARKAAESLNCYAVINQGFERAATVDADKDQANCNCIDQVVVPVVYDEFLKPLITYKEAIKMKLLGVPMLRQQWRLGYGYQSGTTQRVLLFHIHGAGNIVHQEANEQVEVIVGYGLGNKKDSITCSMWRKNLFVDAYRRVATEGDVFEARGGSKYAGRSANNLNQYFKKHQSDPLVESIQLEFPFSTRQTEMAAELTAAKLAIAVDELLKRSSYPNVPVPKFI